MDADFSFLVQGILADRDTITHGNTCSFHSCYYKSLKVGMGTKNYLAAVSSAVEGVLS
jgi:hypothetical protein